MARNQRFIAAFVDQLADRVVHPHRFEHADARQMAGIADASIDLAVFSCNGISMVGHDDRLAIMREVHRILKPQGVFLFTTYNRNSPEARARFRFPDFEASPNPARLLVRGARHLRDTAISVVQRLRHIRQIGRAHV